MKRPRKRLSSGQTVAVVINILEEKAQHGVKIPAERIPGRKEACTVKERVGEYQPLRKKSGQSKQFRPVYGIYTVDPGPCLSLA